MPRLIGPGSAEPLGVVPVDRVADLPPSAGDPAGVNVAVHAPNAEAIDVCLFDATGEIEIDWIRLPARTGDVHHGAISQISVGDRYGLRAHGPWSPAAGHRFNPAKLLVDPFATLIDRPLRLDRSQFDRRIQGASADDTDSAPALAKAIVTAPRFAPPRKALHAWRDLVIYELHVRGFSRLNPAIPPELRGTFAGLGHPASIRHLTELGVTAVELMPAAAGIDERHLPPLGLTNYWGYNPIANLAPDPRLAPGGWPEIRAAVEALQSAGIAVILDVVLNHTGEGDHLGPTVSMRGLDNAAWYRLAADDAGRYANDAGCGNILAADRPVVVRLMLDALRTWAMRAGLDGFRFDLATTLARTPAGFDRDHPFLVALSQDPTLRDLILIAEPWDIGWGGYQLGQFPPGWGEWNDRYRDEARRFWRGDAGRLGAFTTSFAGSSDIFAARHRPVSRSVNFITAHDGFTLADLVSHTSKHNEANGEDNRDGNGDNTSWNHSIEGDTLDPAVRAARARDVRALLATLILSRGTPMLSMGDELGRSQGGNNNAYAQDNEISWLHWANADQELTRFVSRLIKLRRAHPGLRGDAPLTGLPLGPGRPVDVEWLNRHGVPMAADDWSNAGNSLLIAVFGQEDGGRIIVIVQAGWQDVDIALPPPDDGLGWKLELDSADPARPPQPGTVTTLTIAKRSCAVLLEMPDAAAARRSGIDRGQLDLLARAAGIASEWWEVSGRNTQVSPDTKRAILSGMGLGVGSTGEIRDSLAQVSRRRFDCPLPTALVARAGQPVSIPLGGDLARAARSVGLILRREDGKVEEHAIAPRGGREDRVEAPDGGPRLIRRIDLPPLPAGRHRLLLADQPDIATDLIVAPAHCHLPQALKDRRAFGIAAHLYSLRRTGDQGIGDFTTLARFAGTCAGAGALTLGLNPLHAMFADDRDRASPYHPSDRRFLDPIYIDVGSLPAPLRGEAVRAALWSEGRATAALSALASVDYPRVWQSKKKVLDLAFAGFERLLDGNSATPLVQDFDGFVDRGGGQLQRFAEFHAIAEDVGHADWRLWPEDVDRTIRSDRRERAIRYQSFLQWLADMQLADAAASARKAGLALGFYRDLAVGCAPDGAESWAERDRLMAGLSIGAPPDPFSASGQVWNLPPPNPLTMADGGYAGFSGLIAANMAHAGALRIDHAMGLRRLFVVPDGARGAEGAYVDMPFDDLLGVLALESERAQCLVVGEDLGTVPEGFRERLTAAEVLAYRVLWFERDGPGFVPPRLWPAQAAACVSTHDLATLAGWWIGADIAENETLGLIDAPTATAARTARETEKSRLVDLLVAERLLATRPDLASPMDAATSAAVHALVGAAPSLLALAQADDLAGETRAVNLPGTDRERPNWRRKLIPDIDALLASPWAKTAIEAMRSGR